ncbi:MAG: flagellar biosynthetic protein FliO [Alcanivorax sp.]|jgi:flagellar protein FliO/FliZ
MDVISPDLPQFLKLIIALGVVILLMGGLVMVLKMLGLSPQTSVKSGDKRRLKVVESLPLDARRRAVILKCDNKEHLIILNSNGETVIENDIPAVDYSDNSNQDA